MNDCRRCASYKTLVASLESQLARYKTQMVRSSETIDALASERKANAILTAEIEALQHKLWCAEVNSDGYKEHIAELERDKINLADDKNKQAHLRHWIGRADSAESKLKRADHALQEAKRKCLELERRYDERGLQIARLEMRRELSSMQYDERDIGWYFDNNTIYIDVEREDGKYSVFFRNRTDGAEVYAEQKDALIPVHQWRHRPRGAPIEPKWIDATEEDAYSRVDEDYEARTLYMVKHGAD